MNDDKSFKEQLKTMVKKAKCSAKSAKRQIEEGYYDFASFIKLGIEVWGV